jgi:ribosomal protein S15P/S13E
MLEKIQFNKYLCEFYGTYQQVDALQEAIYKMIEHIEALSKDKHDTTPIYENSRPD